MKVLPEKHFNNLYWFVAAIVFFIVVLRCILVPFSHDEVASFLYYIQPGDFIPFFAHPDANGHFLTNLTSWLSFKLFGSSVWALRLPCIGAFLLLTYSVFKVNKLFRGIYPKILFSSAFILSYNFLGFYALCRGYGFSMAFLILAMYYFFVYIRYGAFRHFSKFILFSQFALSSNLTLVIVLLLLSGIVMLYQLKNRVFFSGKNLLIVLVHVSLLLFWIKYGFYLQENGALYYGGGESYWKVTFVSLIETILLSNQYMNVAVVLVFGFMSVMWFTKLMKRGFEFLRNSNFSLSYIVLLGLIIGFYLLKLLLGVNYPEDRTGLFFYVFFALSLALMVNELVISWQILFMGIPIVFIVQFATLLNFRVHPWRVYETMPAGFFEILLKEQKNNDRPITIAGHRVREFFYGFMNYNSSGKLSHITAPEALQMNCDYALAYAQDKPYYDPYYTELAIDEDWDFRLLKRRQSITRHLLYSSDHSAAFKGAYEFYNTYERTDTSFNSTLPLLAVFEISVHKAPVPLNAWLVMQIAGEGENGAESFIRTPLNLIKYDWNGTSHFTTCLVSGNIPLKIKRIVCYIWCVEKQALDLQIDSFKLFQLQGEGIQTISQAKI